MKPRLLKHLLGWCRQKSITGINTDKPVEDLLFYCSSYIEKFEAKDNCLSKEFPEIPDGII